MNRFQSVRIQRFKRIKDAAFDLGQFNVLIGANNSGKSSIIQGLHFGIGLLQKIGLNEKWPKSASTFSTSLNPNQLIYAPSEDIYALASGGKLIERDDQAICFDFNLTSGESCSVRLRKGRNRNILATIKNVETAKTLASLEQPFSIFSPGLAGIAKSENYVSDGVLLRTLARGDANLVLRNILLRLWKTEQWDPFLNDIYHIFPNLGMYIRFNKEIDENISVFVKVPHQWLPLELVGTGVLQAMQILSYIHRFKPKLVVLDEPDSHLHPNNQRLLCSLLRKVAEEQETQILLTTHSRHVVDSVARSSVFLWVRNGMVESASEDDEIGILLDIGALDIKERASTSDVAVIVLTEDEEIKPLEGLLESSGFRMNETVLLPYYGITTIKNLRPLVNVIRNSNPKAKIVIHRDRDFLRDEEVNDWCTKIRALSVEPFVTDGVDVQSHYLQPRYLSGVNTGTDELEFIEMIDKVRSEQENDLIARYVNGRIDIERKNGTYGSLNHGQLAIEANKKVKEDQRYCHGKALLSGLRREFRSRFGRNVTVFKPSSILKIETLSVFASKSFTKL